MKILKLLLAALLTLQISNMDAHAGAYIQWSKTITFEDTKIRPDNDFNDFAGKVETWVSLSQGKISEVTISFTPMTMGATDDVELGINVPFNYDYTYHGENSATTSSGTSSTWIFPYAGQS